VLDLTAVLRKRARNLTADEKQKISMGRGLVRDDVSAILFDEPLTVIDPHLKWKLRRKLKQIHEQFNITMIYVTHDQLEASTFADKIAVMHGGRSCSSARRASCSSGPATPLSATSSAARDEPDRCARRGRRRGFGDVHLVLPRGCVSAWPKAALQVGIRPEFVQVWDTPSMRLPARVWTSRTWAPTDPHPGPGGPPSRRAWARTRCPGPGLGQPAAAMADALPDDLLVEAEP
jgi:glycerol transport system ATP-binding protein